MDIARIPNIQSKKGYDAEEINIILLRYMDTPQTPLIHFFFSINTLVFSGRIRLAGSVGPLVEISFDVRELRP